MNQPIPMFKENGDGYDISPAGVLLIVADTIYGDPSETTPEGRGKGQELIDDILAAARAGGYTQGDILLTLLTRNKPTRRVMAMAQAACDAAGNVALNGVLARAKLLKRGKP